MKFKIGKLDISVIIIIIATFVYIMLLLSIISMFVFKKSFFYNEKILTNIAYINDDYEYKVFNSIQQWRVDNNLPIFKVDDNLCKVAKARSIEIQVNWSHDGLKPNKELHYSSLGENISKDFLNPENILPAWLMSKTHRENLERDYTHFCIKCTNNYCANWFGK